MFIVSPDAPVIETGAPDSVDVLPTHVQPEAAPDGVDPPAPESVEIDLPDVPAAAAELNAAGIATCVVGHGKATHVVGWSTGSARPEQFGPRDGIGILTGSLSDCDRPGHALMAVDLDSPAAVELADMRLPDTGMIEGRAGKPRSHRYYLVPLDTIPAAAYSVAPAASVACTERVGHPGPKTTTFKDPKREILALKGTGGLMACPPTWHVKSGSRREWDGGVRGEPAVIAYHILFNTCKSLASACGWVERPTTNATADPVAPPADIDRASVIGRAVAYMAACPPAVEGQGGHDRLFAVARAVVYGFDLGAEVGAALINQYYNPRCRPPWSDAEIAHKCADADALPFDRPRGYLLADAAEEPDADPEAGGTETEAGDEPADPTPTAPPEDAAGGPKADDNKNKKKAKEKKKKKEKPAEEKGDEEKEGRPTGPGAVDALTAIGCQAERWHDDTQTGYATVGRTTWVIHSKAFKHYLVSEYRKRCGKTPNSEAINNARTAIEADAVHDGPCRTAYVRVAGHGERVYLDLADTASTVIQVDSDGWRVCADPPVRFIRRSGTPLPLPVRGGTIEELRTLVNVSDDDDFALVVAWVTAALRPRGPYPILVVSGDQGSAKSTTAKTLRNLVHPSAAALRAEPSNARDLMIAAKNNWSLAFDNLSYLPPWLSDAMCRLATGGGFATRALYTDDEESIFDAQRPLIVNGIDDFVTRGDLLERALLLRLPPIPEDRRVTEEVYDAAFAAAHPRIFGALLDRVAAGLRAMPGVTLTALPRMADFAKWSVACERGAGEPPRFERAYGASRTIADEQALDATPVAAAVLRVFGTRARWEVTPSALLAALEAAAPDEQRGRDWPRTVIALNAKLKRLVPNLRRLHRIDITCRRTAQARLIVITRLDGGGDPASARGGPPGAMGDAASADTDAGTR